MVRPTTLAGERLAPLPRWQQGRSPRDGRKPTSKGDPVNHEEPSLSRRQLLVRSAALSGAATFAGTFLGCSEPAANAEEKPAADGAIALPKLDYAENALEPVISGRTMSFHYGK